MVTSLFNPAIRQEGIKEGIKKGEMKKAMEVAKNMLNEGIDVKTISKVTGLDIEEIEKAIKKLQ